MCDEAVFHCGNLLNLSERERENGEE